jgi:hypothetical protein
LETGVRSAIKRLLGVLALGAPLPAHAADPEPPPQNVEYFQYGVGLVLETALSGGDVCPAGAPTPCILGSGGGLGLRAGYRSRDPWYVGGAYEFSRQDSSNLIRLAILQQFRVEGRYYFDRGMRATPFVAGALGGMLYGGEWSASTGGGLVSLGAGLEYQVSATTMIGCAPMYRLLVPRAWTDSAGQRRADNVLGFGFAHFFGLELILEVREPLARW